MPGSARPYGGEKVHCRCMLCEYEIELQEGQKCEAVRCPYHGCPLEPDLRISKDGTLAPRGPGRRREEEEAEALIWIPPDGWEPKPPPPAPPMKKCRCPYCDYEIVVEEGARCLNSVCPSCGRSMEEV